MIQDLIKEHAGDIANLLGSKYGLDSKQAATTASTVTNTVGSFFTDQLASGKLDLSHVADLFNSGTSNQGNAIFSQLSSMVTNALSANPGLTKDIISKISTSGLDDILKMLQGGKLGNIDIGTITQIAGALSGKGGGISDLLGNLGGLFGKK
ncbi:MAG TPA: hypothetical protein PLD84_07880 [Chitinophagales bacterium]|nr:hypothetical protein [Chitinophagales bacterium]